MKTKSSLETLPRNFARISIQRAWMPHTTYSNPCRSQNLSTDLPGYQPPLAWHQSKLQTERERAEDDDAANITATKGEGGKVCRPSPSRPRPRPRPLPRSYASCSVEWRDGVLEVCFAVAGAFAGSSSCSNEAEGRERGVTEPTWRGSDMRPRRRRWAARVGPVGPSPTVLCPALPCPYPAVRRCVFRFAEWLDVAPLSLSLSVQLGRGWREDDEEEEICIHACMRISPSLQLLLLLRLLQQLQLLSLR